MTWNAAELQGCVTGGDLAHIRGRWVLDEPVRLPSGTRLHGLGNVAFNPHKPEISGGTIFEVRHTDGPAIILESGASIDNIAFDYPDQNPDTSPEWYPPTIQLGTKGHGCYDQSVTNCTFYKSYVGIDARGSQLGNVPISNLTVTGNRGVTLSAFMQLDYVADWVNIERNNLNAGRANPLALKSGMVKWIAENGVMFRVGGCDWLKLTNNQAWGYRKAVEIRAAEGYAASGPYTIEGNQFDACQTGVDLRGSYAQAVRIRDNVFCPFNAATGEQGIAININDGVGLDSLRVVDNHAFGPMKHFMWSGGYCRDVRIEGNHARTSGSQGYGISLLGQPYTGNNLLRGFAG